MAVRVLHAASPGGLRERNFLGCASTGIGKKSVGLDYGRYRNSLQSHGAVVARAARSAIEDGGRITIHGPSETPATVRSEY